MQCVDLPSCVLRLASREIRRTVLTVRLWVMMLLTERVREGGAGPAGEARGFLRQVREDERRADEEGGWDEGLQGALSD